MVKKSTSKKMRLKGGGNRKSKFGLFFKAPKVIHAKNSKKNFENFLVSYGPKCVYFSPNFRYKTKMARCSGQSQVGQRKGALLKGNRCRITMLKFGVIPSSHCRDIATTS